MEKRERKIPLSVKIGYGATGYAALFTFTIVITYGMYFFTDVAGIPATFAGVLLSLGTIVDAVTNPLFGAFSDKRDPKKGRRRPFLLVVAVPFGIISWLLFTDWGFGETMTMVYFTVMIILFYMAQSCLDVPYTALGSEMIEDYDERTRLSSIRYTWATVGGVISAVTMAVTAALGEYLGSETMGWSVTNLIFGIICTITIFITWRTTKGYERTDAQDDEPFSFRQIFTGPFSNKPFRHVAAAYLFGIIGQTVAVSCVVYYMTYNLQLSDNQVSIAMTVMWIVAFGWIAVTNYICLKISKTAAWVFAMAVWIVTLFVFIWILNIPGRAITVYFMTSIYVVGYNAIYQVTWAAIPDCVEVDEFKTGKRREGIYYSVASFLQKMGSAVAFLVCGSVITYIGYDPNLLVQPEKTLLGFKIMLTFGTSIFLLCSIIAVVTNPMTKKRHKAVLEAIEAKKSGKPYTTDGFKKLL